MLKFAYLVLKNLGRNKLRTTLTALAVIVLVAIYSMVSTVTESVARMVKAQSGQTRLVVTERWVMPSTFPYRYVQQIGALPGVSDWTVWHFYGGFFDESRRRDRAGVGFGTRVDNIVEMHPALKGVDPAYIEALRHEKTGVLMGAGVMDEMGWKIGQKFTFVNALNVGKNLEFKIVGVVPSGQLTKSFFFREDYYQEGTGDKATANVLWLRVPDAATGDRVAAEIERTFENSQPPMKVETESAGIARFAGRSQAVLSIIELVVNILLIDMVVILSNSIGITTRERKPEMAVLKVLGFLPTHIMAMVVGEAMLVGAVSGLLGTALAYSASVLNASNLLPFKVAFLLAFPIPAMVIPWGFVMGAGIGLLGSAIPAWNARKVKVSDVFAKIA